MYVAVSRNGRRVSFELRRTVGVIGGLGFEVVMDLGDDFGRVVHFGRFGISYAESIHEAVARLNLDMDELDEAFAPFAPPGYRNVPSRGTTWKRTVLNATQEEVVRALHPFDRRRMAYLRSGAMDLSRINEVNPKLFRELAGKGRDEVEQLFLRMERFLPQEEARSYVHAILNLQRHFPTLTARSMPETLDPVQLDEAFMHEFCAILHDKSFAFGLPEGAQSYLQRYIYMHFDFEFVSASGFERIFEEFMNDFRRLPPRPQPVSAERVRELFGLGMAEIRGLSRREFARIFRKKAMSMHPDKGGDHDAFVELLETYKRLVTAKPEDR